MLATSESFCPFIFTKIEPEANRRSGKRCPISRSGHRCVTDDANLYSFGGYNPKVAADSRGPLFRELWRFNLATKSWTKVKMNGCPPRELASHAAVLCGQHLMVYGGTGIPFGSSSSNSLHICDLTTYVWREMKTSGELPPKLYGQAIALHDGYLFVYGGTTGYDYTSDVHCLNLKTGVWELKETKQKPAERYRHELACYDEALYVFGGGKATENFGFDSIPVFNLKTLEWTMMSSKADMNAAIHQLPGTDSPGIPNARKYHSLVQHNEDAFICGGYNDEAIFPDVWKVHLPNLQWTRLSCQLPVPVFFHAATLTSSGCMYIFGGVTQVDQKRRTSNIYSVWLSLPSLKEMCWTIILRYLSDPSSIPRAQWLQMGVPRDLVDRIDHRARCG